MIPGSLAVLWPTSALSASLLGTHRYGITGESRVLLVTDKAKAKVPKIKRSGQKCQISFSLLSSALLIKFLLFICIYAVVVYSLKGQIM